MASVEIENYFHGNAVMRNAMQALLLTVICLVAISLPAGAQSVVGQPKAARVVTNGELSAERPFTLLILHNGSQASKLIAQIVTKPGPTMQSWSQAVDLKVMDVRDQRADQGTVCRDGVRAPVPGR